MTRLTAPFLMTIRSLLPASPGTRNAVSPAVLVLMSSVFVVLVFNRAYWRVVDNGIAGGFAEAPLLAVQMGLLLAGVVLLLISLLHWRYLLKPALAVLLLAGASASHFMDSYGVIIDEGMLRNALQTDRAEAAGLMTVSGITWFVMLGVVPALLVLRLRLRWASGWRNLAQTGALIALALVIIAASAAIDFKAAAPFVREHGKQMRWRAVPLNLAHASMNLFRHGDLAAGPVVKLPIARFVGQPAAVPGARYDPILVLVVGETARAGNFSLNGYARQTNPMLSLLPVVNFNQVSSCGTSTAVSVPCLFSDLGRADFSVSAARARENLLDIAKRAGYRVVWIDNQAGSKGVADSVEFRQLAGDTALQGEVGDHEFVGALRHELAASAGPTLLVLHQMGSHGPEYYKRSRPAMKAFLPECRTAELQKCSSEEIRNAYDNTILETDQLLADLIGVLGGEATSRPASLLYVSDHGESLGEGGLYLHGMPYLLAPKDQTSVPMIYWSNQAGKESGGLDEPCLRGIADQALSHDHYFNTVLGLLRIDTDVYRRDGDAFSACRRQPPGGSGRRDAGLPPDRAS